MHSNGGQDALYLILNRLCDLQCLPDQETEKMSLEKATDLTFFNTIFQLQPRFPRDSPNTTEARPGNE